MLRWWAQQSLPNEWENLDDNRSTTSAIEIEPLVLRQHLGSHVATDLVVFFSYHARNFECVDDVPNEAYKNEVTQDL